MAVTVPAPAPVVTQVAGPAPAKSIFDQPVLSIADILMGNDKAQASVPAPAAALAPPSPAYNSNLDPFKAATVSHSVGDAYKLYLANEAK